jgi:protein-L-isoaspartate(D-aspartate) O-methyltransferase
MEPIEMARSVFAEKIREMAALKSDGLVRGLASVPREEFIGPGPWQILRLPNLAGGYVTTPDADPRHLYDNVLVALDPGRGLNNGEPASLARWLDSLDLAPGNQFLHVGCGVGYYTAIAAEAVNPGGGVVAVEVDPELAERARKNLRPWQHVRVVSGDGSQNGDARFDGIFVNAGATEPMSTWLDQLAVKGRLLLPLTVDAPVPIHGVGHMWLITRQSARYSARIVSGVGVFPCAGARTPEGNDLLRRAYDTGGFDQVRSLRRDPHPADEHCWLHASRFCLSRRALEN